MCILDTNFFLFFHYDAEKKWWSDGTMKEKKYPMTYKEYEKRVIELFLETGNYVTKEEKLEFLNEELLKNDPDFIKNLYKDDCFYYDHPERFGIAAKYVFEDTNLLGTPVSNLEMLF